MRVTLKELKYLSHYSPEMQEQVQALIKSGQLGSFIKDQYPKPHPYASDKGLYNYAVELKNRYLRNAPAMSKVLYDDKINVLHQALGTHSFVSRVQGSKVKSKNEIRVASVFKKAPLEFLRMIVVHELAHFKEKDHNKAFYKLCEYMEPSYHQIEFNLRLYLTHLDLFGSLY